MLFWFFGSSHLLVMFPAIFLFCGWGNPECNVGWATERERESDVSSTNRCLRTAGGKVKPQRSMAWLQSFVLIYVHGLWLSGLTCSICSKGGGGTIFNYLIIKQDPSSGLMNTRGRFQSWATQTLPDHDRVIISGFFLTCYQILLILHWSSWKRLVP